MFRLKKIISVMLAGVVSFSIPALPAFAESQSNDFMIRNGVILEYDGRGGDVKIPSYVKGICTDAFRDNPTITSVSIPSSVTVIGKQAFVNCAKLTNISVDANNSDYSSENGVLFDRDKTHLIQCPAGFTNDSYNIPDSVKFIDDYAFNGCSITSVNIPSGLTRICDTAFSNVNLSNITVDKNSTIYSSENGVLYSKDKSQLILYPIGNDQTSFTLPANVKSINNLALSGCYNLTSILVDKSNTAFTSDNGVLYNKDKTKLIQYPIANTQKSYTVPDGVIDIGTQSFDSCLYLTSITLPSSIKNLEYGCFSYCMNLNTFTIASNDAHFGDSLFVYCGENFTIYAHKNSSADTYANQNYFSFSILGPVFGTPKYSTTALTNKNVTVTVPVIQGAVTSVSHTFTANGSYTFTVSDKAGNKASLNVKVSNIDKTKPSIKVSIGNGRKTNKSVTVTVSDSNLKAKSVKLNGKSIAWPGNSTFTAKGSYSVTAQDKAGNVSTASFQL